MLDINDDISQRTSESTSYVCYFLSIQIIENMWLEITVIRSRAVTERLSDRDSTDSWIIHSGPRVAVKHWFSMVDFESLRIGSNLC